MARPLRVEFEEAIYHLCARGNARQRIFCDERKRGKGVSQEILTIESLQASSSKTAIMPGNKFRAAFIM
jgi:hypothetical protein